MDNTKAIKALVKDLQDTPHEIGMGLLRERLLTHAVNDLKTLATNPEAFRNPVFGVGMYRDLFQRTIRILNFGDVCDDCCGVGYLTDVNEKGNIERCDSCQVFATDQEAERHHKSLAPKSDDEYLVKREVKDEHPYSKLSQEDLLDTALWLNLMYKKERRQSAWLDRLADHERDHANDSSSSMEEHDESKAECDALYEEYQATSKSVQEKLN